MLNIHSYKGNEPYIFISYAHRDSASVYPVIAQMQKDGYRVWFDEGIDPGTEWDENIAMHVDECGYFIAFVSENYLGSNNCKDELNYARDLSKKIVLVYLEDVQLTRGMAMRMNRLQSIFKYKYPSNEAFFEKFYESDGLSAFTSGVSQLATKPDAPTVGTYAPNKKDSDTIKTNLTGNGNTSSGKKPPAVTIAPPPGAHMETIKYASGSVYVGEVNSSGEPHGYGTITFGDGDVYEGQWQNNKKHGQGIYKFASGNSYVGDWRDDKRNGYGTYTYADGDVYEGEFRDGKRNGRGTYRYKSGNVYEGDWKDGDRTGRGIFRYKSGDVYEGDFVKNNFHGNGTYYYKSGDRYEGQWENDKKHGYGTYYYKSGQIYEGNWIEGRREGYGTYRFPSGGYYEGEFVAGKYCGHGVYHYPNGDVYDGEWKDDQRHGEGTYYYADGSIHHGTWKNGKRVE